MWEIFIHNVWEIFAELVRRYVSDAWPFALAHALVAFSLIRQSWWRKIRVETLALRSWTPKSRQDDHQPQTSKVAEPKGETTKILDQFIHESEQLGNQGFFVPMTDFSDRLDSIVDGMVAELHDRTNLFLLVGIAGTLFGVFEFSYRAYGTLISGAPSSQSITNFGQFLAGSMAKAFPVGFMGLAFTFTSQIVAPYPESKLRAALASATGKAIRRRREVSRSQAEIIREAAESIRESMVPLQDLKETLTLSVQPVVAEFGARLDDSLKLVEEQFEQLDRSTKAVYDAVEGVKESVTQLHQIAGSLKGTLETTPEMLRGISDLQKSQRKALDHFETATNDQLQHVRDLQDALGRILKATDSLPDTLSERAAESFNEVTVRSVDTWEEMTEKFVGGTQSSYVAYLKVIESKTEGIRSRLDAAATEWERLARNADRLLREPLQQVVQEAKSELSTGIKQIDTKLIDRLPQLTTDLAGLKSSLDQLLSKFAEVHKAIDMWLQDNERIRTIVNESQDSMRALDLMAEHVKQLQNVSQFVKNIDEQVPVVRNGFKSELEEQRRLLSGIRADLQRLAHREGIIDRSLRFLRRR